MSYGVIVKEDVGDTRIEIQCEHQKGLMYVVPAEASWVCDKENIHAHALAGFFRELIDLSDIRIRDLMQRWGIYYRVKQIDESLEE